jgi:hypothetical protein
MKNIFGPFLIDVVVGVDNVIILMPDMPNLSIQLIEFQPSEAAK